ncbi:alpha/beta fold hydrolase [Amycolatopsis jejuensis]|uniref:alpha/beta fold hydrolase n=1 Tax=Amycolatopsis jejuensis TaxID=330084 RepID=UPI00069018D9|nr:alpha/beta fold hydrolase [Amycolatopsis jejuensis]
MSHYVLVHGSWCGGWVWDDIAARLRAGGHTVETPTLSEGSGLHQHIDEVVSLLEPDDVTLVGHSYGGMVITGAASCAQVREAVYLDAFLPRPGESAFDLLPMLRGLFAEAAAGETVPPFGFDRFGMTDPAFLARLRPISIATHTEALPRAAVSPQRYVLFGSQSLFAGMAGRASQCQVLETGHFGLVTDPDTVHSAIIERPAP